MQRWTSRTQHRYIAEINLVPYMDLVFVLLFVFMLAVPLLKTETAPSSVPAVPTLPTDYVVLELSSADHLILDGRGLSSAELPPALKNLVASRPGVGVMIKLAGNQPVQRVVELTAVLREAGVQRTAVQTFSWSQPTP